MKILIPCAGRSRRFVDAGYTTPKALLPVTVDGASLSMAQTASRRATYPYQRLYGVDPEHIELFRDALPLDATVVPAQRRLLGQSGTILDLALECNADEDVLVLNCDVFHDVDIDRFIQMAKLEDTDCLVSIFESRNPAYSYINGYPSFEMAMEKMVISSYALSGMYYFRTARALAKAIDEQIASGSTVRGEMYISQAFQYITGEKTTWLYDADYIHDLGTPELYEKFNKGDGS